MNKKKALTLCILEILKEYTDENHFLTQREIAQFLEDKYQLTVERKAIGDSLELLNSLGYDVNKKEGGFGFALYSRLIDPSEMTFLADSILSAKTLTSNMAKSLIQRLQTLLSVNNRKNHDYIDKSVDSTRSNNADIFLNIEILSEAIKEKKKITFKYLQYDINGLLKEREGKYYKVNPYFLVNNYGKYYLLANYEKYDNVSNFRIEYMKDIKIVNDSSVKPLNKIIGFGDNFNIGKYLSEHIYIFGGDVVEAKIRFESRNCFTYIFEWFGKNARIEKVSDDCYIATVKCDEKAIIYWALQYGSLFEVISPDSTRNNIRHVIQNLWLKYR